MVQTRYGGGGAEVTKPYLRKKRGIGGVEWRRLGSGQNGVGSTRASRRMIRTVPIDGRQNGRTMVHGWSTLESYRVVEITIKHNTSTKE